MSKYLKVTGSLRVGDRFDANGDVINSSVSGAWLGNNGMLKAQNASISGDIDGNITVRNLTVRAYAGNIIYYSGPIAWANKDYFTPIVAYIYPRVLGSCRINAVFRTSVPSHTYRECKFIILKNGIDTGYYVEFHEGPPYYSLTKTLTCDISLESFDDLIQIKWINEGGDSKFSLSNSEGASYFTIGYNVDLGVYKYIANNL